MIFREVQQQSRDGILGPKSVSTVTIFEDEVREHLRLSAALHIMSGWLVTVNDETVVAVARRDTPTGHVVRSIWFEAYDPATDGSTV